MWSRFRHPWNGYVESVGPLAILWAFLFGPIYFAVRRVWLHAAILLAIDVALWSTFWIFALPFVALAHGIYALLAPGIVKRDLLRRGYARA